ncbi:MAG TPA: ABC transporter ATP-binding protein [Rhodanobacteraceae bacterium]|nr:ABC transporter ATP-binding protein [Rhodanobacteraceae bacterium]
MEWQRMLSWFGSRQKPANEKWVLRHISFQVFCGECVGIIGQNGAGKSTLLKLVTGTLRPSEGSVQAAGRIAAILELGMGFNPELTGRDNARYTAGLMGMSPQEIDDLMPAVEEFAEIGEYFDQPLRTYSSGMQMRVAFSVVTAIRPEILIIDEALSVGDIYFAHKSMARIRQFREQGTTLLFVSHDPGAIQSLCDRAVLLDRGRLLMDGSPSAVMDYYNALIAEKENDSVEVRQLESGEAQTISGTREAVVETIGLFNGAGVPVEFVNVGEPVELRVRARAHGDISRLVFGYMIKDRLGQPVFGTNTHHTRQALETVKDGQTIEFRASFPMNLGPGSYSVSTALCSTDTHLIDNYEWRDLALLFTVANQDRDFFVGSAWVPPIIEIRREQ